MPGTEAPRQPVPPKDKLRKMQLASMDTLHRICNAGIEAARARCAEAARAREAQRADTVETAREANASRVRQTHVRD